MRNGKQRSFRRHCEAVIAFFYERRLSGWQRTHADRA
jgi:hypothetical protein